ncbi:MAG: hypothetical protein L0H63_09995 [Nitrococcus sp.]|nr:hypothetical protein [Nitrococcus sp.]
MTNANLLPSQQAAVVATIDPDATSASTVVSDYVDMEGFEALLAIVLAGALGTSATVDAKLVQATDASGTGSKDITGKAITQLTQAGTDDDKQALINLMADEMDHENDFTFAALSLTVATAACDVGAVVLGFYPHYGPANNNDLASVDEIVS